MVNKRLMKRYLPKKVVPKVANVASVGGEPLVLPNRMFGKDINTYRVNFGEGTYIAFDGTDTIFRNTPGTLLFKIADKPMFRITYTHVDVIRDEFRIYYGANYSGFKTPAALSVDQIYTLPELDGSANQALKTDGSGNLGWVTVPTDYSDIPRTQVTTYRNLLAEAIDTILALRTWQDETVTIFAAQPSYVRNVSVTVIPDPLNTITGTVTVNGIDSDSTTIQEVFTFDTNVLETQKGSKQFGVFTSVVIDATGAGTGNYSVGIGSKIGFENYPWQAGDVIKVTKNDVHYDSSKYTVDITNGTIEDTGASIMDGDDYTTWIKPYK